MVSPERIPLPCSFGFLEELGANPPGDLTGAKQLAVVTISIIITCSTSRKAEKKERIKFVLFVHLRRIALPCVKSSDDACVVSYFGLHG